MSRLSEDQRQQPLSERERQVVAMVVQEGLANKEIARRLGTSCQTVKNQMTAIFEKTEQHDRLNLAIWYYREQVKQLQLTVARHSRCADLCPLLCPKGHP